MPAVSDAPVRVVMGPQDDEFSDEAKALFLASEWKVSATSDRMGYRLEGPVIKHLHGHNIVSDGTVNGSVQVPGNGQPIVLMPDRGTSGGYPKIATVITADFGRFAQIPAGRGFRFKAVAMAEAQAEAKKFAELLRTLPDRLRGIDNVDINIEALSDANVAGSAVSAVDAGTWPVAVSQQDQRSKDSTMKTVDLNCDLGESFGPWEMGNDAAMIELATSVNVACGFHAGDADIMRHTVELAKARGVSVGAHPGYRDLHGFGRRPVPGLKSSEIENLIAYQIGALQAIATAAGHKVTHVKVHGALSNVACEDDMTAKALASAIKAVDPNLIFVVLANSKLVKAGEDANLPMVHEVFADRAYEDSGSLVSRKKPGAVLHDAKQIAERVLRMVQDGAVVSVTGKVIKMRTDTVCIHGDTPGAVEIAQEREAGAEGRRNRRCAVQEAELNARAEAGTLDFEFEERKIALQISLRVFLNPNFRNG